MNMTLSAARYRLDPKPQYIFYHEFLCGRVGNPSTLYHCPICQGVVAKVVDDPNPEGWDYVCPACSKLVVPFEIVTAPGYQDKHQTGNPAQVGILIAVPILLTYENHSQAAAK